MSCKGLGECDGSKEVLLELLMNSFHSVDQWSATSLPQRMSLHEMTENILYFLCWSDCRVCARIVNEDVHPTEYANGLKCYSSNFFVGNFQVKDKRASTQSP